MAYMRLGDLLIAAGAITQEQLEEALTIQKQTKERLGDVLIENNIITERQLIEALQMQLGVDFIDLTAISIPLELAKFVPRAIAKKYNVVPVKLVKDELFVAMSDPLNFVAQEEIKAASHKRVVPMISTRRATEQAIGTLYGSEGTARAIEEMKREVGTSTPDIVPVQMNQTDAGNASAAPTIRFVNSVIERAFLERASDIHLEPQEGEMVVRMRIDGILRKILTVPANLQSNVISRLKIMGGMNISERKIPQDGRAMVQVRHHEIDLRISSMPTIYGEKIVLRLLDKSGHTITKQSIGLEGTDLQKYDALLKNSSGVILIVGPTGSGKSTTMCAMLQELANEETNLMTLEDPVEYNIPGVNQCQINEKTGMTFATGLRAILRQDPDVISVGEIRDGETGAIAIRAAITGHLVLSTLHTNDAVSAIDRLVDIGVEPYLISSALRGVISQRLVRKVCPHCKKAYRPEAEELAMLGLPENANVQFYRGEGCQECYHTGYKGRRAVFEIFMLNGRIRRMVKIMGGMNISERKIPQDGRAMVQVRHHEIDLRISSMPTIYGEKIVLRLLDKSGHTITKQSIGLEGTDLQKYDALLKNSSGVILIVGPTGSGKSTTMCAMLQELANEETNLMTLEDPVEYNIPGVNQCQINEKTGMTFATGLRAILRQDPDVISVGEIRDGETGAIAIRAAITGHLVLSTLHTNDAVSAIDRLVDIGVEPYLISSALRGVISQRLVRKVCPHCKKAYRPEAEELAMLGLPENANVQFYRGEGCQECYHTGYKGRRAVFEIFMLNGRIRRMVTEGAKYDALLRAATETNFVTMRENCRNLVLRGEISAAEAARAINSTAD